jgi:hypothetical protein
LERHLDLRQREMSLPYQGGYEVALIGVRVM